MSGAALAGGLGIGAGVGVSSVALAPFNAANTFLGSAFFGYGMILGERYMYQADWPKIQQRLENGEKIENIIQEYTGVFTATVMKEAKIIFDTVTREFLAIMKEALRTTTQDAEEHLAHGHLPHTGKLAIPPDLIIPPPPPPPPIPTSDPHKFLTTAQKQEHIAHGHLPFTPTKTVQLWSFNYDARNGNAFATTGGVQNMIIEAKRWFKLAFPAGTFVSFSMRAKQATGNSNISRFVGVLKYK